MAIQFPNSIMDECGGETWRMTTTFSGDDNTVENWERSDDVYGGGNFDSSPILTESSGIFTFNADLYGYYFITWSHYVYYTSGSRFNEMSLLVSWNSGSDYDNHGYGSSSIAIGESGNNSSSSSYSSLILATANTRLRFSVNVSNNSTYTFGDSTYGATGFSLIKASGV